ncbi:cysteine desulfurase [Verrucomicrobiota bacterium]|nr:cysteine desulfurase [Verrucomicrobiota bacterium]
MTLPELLANEDLRRHEFPVVQERIFLGHAGVCPLPRRVADAIAATAQRGARNDQEHEVAPLLKHTRGLAAQLLAAKPEEIAFVGPTSLALSMVAAGLSFRKGSNILIYHDDFPSNVYPWMALADRGVEVRFLNTRDLGRIRRIDVLGQIDEQTRLVALTSCHYLSGFRLELEAIGRELSQRGILFCVDGIQTLGAFPTTVEHVDFLAADSHKWLLGPCGAGLLYVRQSRLDTLHPVVYGWHNVRSPNYIPEENIVFRQDARRYEAGSHSIIGLAGLSAALELLLEIGIDAIGRELLRKRAWLVPALQTKGWTVLNADAAIPNASGILTIHRPDTDLPALHQRLTDAHIVTSLRSDRAGQRYLRLSPHFYNTDAELHRTLELL